MSPYRRKKKLFSRKKKKPVRPARKKKKKGFAAKMKTLWLIIKVLSVLGVIALGALAYHFHGIDRMIEAKFDQPRKWDLPSRIYSDLEYIYPGASTGVTDIVSKLDRLGYRNAGTSIRGAGEYARNKTILEIYLHDFEYPEGLFRGFPVRITFKSGSVVEMVNMETSEPMPLVRLEPEEIASVFNELMEDRTIVPLTDVPPELVEAIILIEDERFFEHGGVDPIGIVRAAFVNLKSMRIAQGGSTLTQQLVKNFFLYPKKSFVRKINEMVIAYRIERAHTKGEILGAYLNEIYLGQRGASSVSGVAEASRLYFGKSVSQLSLGESALLAGMIRSPHSYNPITKPEKAKARRDFVLKRMLDAELVDEKQYDEAKSERIITPKRRVRAHTAPYFIDLVKRQLSDLYPQEVLQTEGLRIFTTLDMSMQIAADRALVGGLKSLEKAYASILPKDHAELLQSCIIAVQPSSGYVRALVGGRDYGLSQFDRCTQAMRQPGSTFKPFVYLTALDSRRSDKHFTPASIIEDKEFEIESGGETWRPRNYDKKEHGSVTLRTSLEKSYNISTAKLALDVGLENVVKTARDAGITSEMSPVPSIALGAMEVTPMEMASAYMIFPNGGIRARPISIINVMTKEGEVLEKKSIRVKRMFDAGPVYLTTNLLKGVVDRGTGRGTRALGFEGVAAGKTGTTSNYRDAWFVGFTPKLLSLVWVGYDDNAEMKMSGGRAALPIWTRFMKDVAQGEKSDFPGPSDVVLVKVNPETGGVVDRSCPDWIYEAFIEGTEPEKTCTEIREELQLQLSAPAFKEF
jgi:penicillin-binding protein 1B